MTTPHDSRQARIDPRSVIAEQIRSLPNGQSGFVVPWAFLADESGAVYIRGDYSWGSRADGTRAHPIERRNGRIQTDEVPKVDYLVSLTSLAHAQRHWAAEPVFIKAHV